MKIKNLIIVTLLFLLNTSCSKNNNEANQTHQYPSFGPEIAVNIDGLSFDAMEPFLSPDGNYLFFNNVNDGINTKLFYANKIDNSTFTFVGELTGTNQTNPPYLDAVADLDANNNFYWTSTRNYPNELDNLFHGTFDSGKVTNIERVRGDFNKNTPGWLVMDHSISLDGTFLYFNNARFDDQNCQGPCEANIGIAKKINANTFTTLTNSSSILQNINDATYITYAPCISSDNLELYYTRYLKGQITANTIFEICVAVRNNVLEPFLTPKILFSEPISSLIEAPTLTVDKKIIYYHKKTGNLHQIKMRNRN